MEQAEATAARMGLEKERLEKFVDRFRYKASKARQVQSRVKMLEKLEQQETPLTPATTRRVHFHFPPAPPSGRTVLELKSVTKHYGVVDVFDDANVALTRGEKVALVGVNGAGKSTLCRLIVGVESPTRGEVKLGHNVTVDYFAQDADFHLVPGLNVLEQLEAESGSAPQAGLRSLLGAFLFRATMSTSRCPYFRAAKSRASRWQRCCCTRQILLSSTSPRTTSTWPRRMCYWTR